MDPCPGPLFLPKADLDFVLAGLGPHWSEFRGKRIFITGGTGFVGRWLIGSILHANTCGNLGCEIVVLSRDPRHFLTAFPDLRNERSLKLIQGDVKDFEYPKGLFEIIIHAAADVLNQPSRLALLDDCIRGTRRVLDFAVERSVSSLLLLSSGAVYGKSEHESQRFRETSPSTLDSTNSSSAYGEGKRVSELLCSVYADQYSFKLKIARLFAFVGAHLSLQGPFAIGNFVRDALTKDQVLISGDGSPVRSYLDSKDLAVWLLKILFAGESGAVFNVGGQHPISIQGLAELVVSLTNSKAEICVAGQRGLNGPQWYVPDTSKARSILELAESETLSSSILKYVDWNQRFHQI
jgi:nucleoside-diphosphate-sugar epimerase